jgi:hypothetical protein
MPTTTTTPNPAQLARAEQLLTALRRDNPKSRFTRNRRGNVVGIWLPTRKVYVALLIWIDGETEESQGWAYAFGKEPEGQPFVKPGDWIE